MKNIVLSWQEIIDSDREYIYLVGYGSLIDLNSHHSVKSYLAPVKVSGYKRIFSLSYSQEICDDIEYNKRFVKSAGIFNEDYKLSDNKLSYMQNSGAFGVHKCSECELNGLLLKIDRKDFLSYSIREHKYKLHSVDVDFYNAADKKIENDDIFILYINPEENCNANFYYLYQKSCRIGAYRQGVEFGKFYDKSTFSYNGELAYVELNERIFYVGRKFVIKSNLVTISLFPEHSEILIKAEGEEVELIENDKYLSKVIVLSTGEEIWLDKSDLSLI